MDKPEVKIFDNVRCLSNPRSHICANPYIDWYTGDEDRDLVVFTDKDIHRAPELSAKYKVAWMIESPDVTTKEHKLVKKLEKHLS